MTYTMIEAGEGTGGGCRPKSRAHRRYGSFIEVDDVHGTTERVRTLGGIFPGERGAGLWLVQRPH
jgi:predicted enzyme related to lactoylglutathione lyase